MGIGGFREEVDGRGNVDLSARDDRADHTVSLAGGDGVIFIEVVSEDAGHREIESIFNEFEADFIADIEFVPFVSPFFIIDAVIASLEVFEIVAFGMFSQEVEEQVIPFKGSHIAEADVSDEFEAEGIGFCRFWVFCFYEGIIGAILIGECFDDVLPDEVFVADAIFFLEFGLMRAVFTAFHGGFIEEFCAEPEFEAVDGAHASGDAEGEYGIVAMLFFEVTGVTDTDEEVSFFMRPSGGEADGFIEDFGEFHVIEAEVTEIVVERTDLPDDIFDEDVSSFGVELRESEAAERTVEQVGGVCGAAFDFGVQAGPDFVGTWRRFNELQAHIECGPSGFIHQSSGDIPEAELRFTALEVRACSDAEVTAGRKSVIVSIGHIGCHPCESKSHDNGQEGQKTAHCLRHQDFLKGLGG